MVSSKSSFHARSVSFPSQPHPLISQVDEHLCRLQTSEATSSSSLSSIAERLSVVEDMYDCVDDLILLPNTQQAFAQKQNEKWVEEVVDGYLHLLDLCAAAKDTSSQTKQDVQDLLSSLRRRRDGSELGGYLTSRKKAKKVIQKSLKNLKSIKSKHMHKDLDTEAIFTLLKGVEAVTVSVFESLLSYIGLTKVPSRPSGFSLVSKLMQGKKVEPQDEEANSNEFEKVDAALRNLLIAHKTGRNENKIDLEKVQNQLQTIELGIQDLEEGLECLFRRFIKTRVSLLNIINH
ncbi:Receptor-type tyrosine-protein like [Actinidia chinensis var. chinensis]|uniref:Receptor-type tyrosine-protein like n=1 Tax=Actinidia chinensis var. chinensis TaxID=1590841 RepID=A0A2R6R724_ACTCC|nr:Receptor-type tyrosine-protein like [Actinidia chinensis var. chinensis]